MTPPAVEENLTHQLVGSTKGATVGSDHGLSLGCLGPICRKARGVVSRWRAEKERKRRTSRNLPRIEASAICAWRQNLQKAGKRGFFRWKDWGAELRSGHSYKTAEIMFLKFTPRSSSHSWCFFFKLFWNRSLRIPMWLWASQVLFLVQTYCNARQVLSWRLKTKLNL